MIFNRSKIHIFFFLILSFNYLLPIIFFGEITLFYHDKLDGEIVFNRVLGHLYSNDNKDLEYFLSGEIKIEHLRRVFQPFTIFYTYLEAHYAYFLIDVLVKITSYISFYVLSKKITNSILYSGLLACLFASLNERTLDGFGLAIIPYVIYLISYKNKIKIKHYLIVFLVGINSDPVTTLAVFPAIFILNFLILNKDFKNIFFDTAKILTIFALSIIISNFNLILGEIYLPPSHRSDFYYEYSNLFDNIINYFFSFFKFSTSLSFIFIKNIPYSVVYLTITFLTLKTILIKKNETLKKIFLLIFFLHLIPFFLKIKFFVDLRNISVGIFKSFQFEYIISITSILFLILMAFIIRIEKKINIYIKYLFLFIIIFLQINSSLIPIIKKYYLKEDNYRNIYTFSGYYMYEDYKKIKEITGNSKTLSIGYDPMIAVMNKIYVIDGYHTLYPLSYKKKFRKVIEKELEKSIYLKKYYDNWGSRVYAFISDIHNIDLDFIEAKKLGADYVISKFKIDKGNLYLVSTSFKNEIYLYKINN